METLCVAMNARTSQYDHKMSAYVLLKSNKNLAVKNRPPL